MGKHYKIIVPPADGRINWVTFLLFQQISTQITDARAPCHHHCARNKDGEADGSRWTRYVFTFQPITARFHLN